VREDTSQTLTAQKCWELIAGQSVGRLALSLKALPGWLLIITAKVASPSGPIDPSEHEGHLNVVPQGEGVCERRGIW
jgi:hypothetical protein